MASTRKSDERTIARTYRAAIRIGEDFITLEETITLPIDASDEEVAQAIDLGWRVYQAQRAAAESQINEIREAAGHPPAITVRDPESPASDKQRNYITTLQEQLGWNGEQLGAYAMEQRIDLVTLTKGQASSFIDGLKKVAEERVSYGESRQRGEAAEAAVGSSTSASAELPINEKQFRALETLAQQRGIDLNEEAQRRYNVEARALRSDQAASLLRDLQRPARRSSESAL